VTWFKKQLSRAAIAGVVLLLLVLIAAEGLVLWLQTPSGNHALRRLISEQVTGLMSEGELRVGDLSTDLFTHLRLSDVSLDDGSGRPVVALDTLTVDWRATALWNKDVALDRVVLQGPVVDLRTDEQGELDLVRMFPSDPDAEPGSWEGLPVDILLGELQVEDGRVSYSDGETQVAIEDLAIGLRASTDGRDVHGDSLVVSGQLGAPLALPISVRGGTRFTDGDLVVDGLVAAVGEDAVRIDGTVRDLEDPDALALEGVQIRGVGLDLDRVETWAGELGLKGTVDLEVESTGPLEAVAVVARIRTPGGRIEAAAALDLAAETPTWTARVDTQGFECEELVDAVTESLYFNATLDARGTGLAFPDGIDATGELVARPSVVWGYPLDDASAALRWTDGQGLIDAFEASMGWGAASGSGVLTLTGTQLDVQARVNDLQGLAVFGVPDIGGVANAQGELGVDWSGVEAEVLFDGTTRVQRVDVMEVVDVGHYRGTVTAQVLGASVEVSGSGRAEGVDVSGALLDGVDVSWGASVREDGAFRWEADLDGGALDVAGFLGVVHVSGTATGEDDGITDPQILARLALSEVHLGAIRGDAGDLVVGLQGDALRAHLQLAEEGADRLALRAEGDLATGRYEVPRLELVPPDAAPWVNPEPLRVHVVDGGVQDVSVLLASDAGQLAIEGDFLAGERVDLSAAVEGFQLDWIEALVRDSTGGWGGVAAASLKLEGDASSTRLDAQLGVQDIVIPDQVDGVDVEVSVRGLDQQMAVQLRAADDEHMLLWGGGDVPISVDLDAPGPVPDGELGVILTGGPWDLVALGAKVPALAGLGAGQASGELSLGGALVAPVIDLALGLELGVGAPPEYLRMDLDLHSEGGAIVATGEARQAGQAQLLLDGTAATGLEEVLRGALVADAPQPDTGRTDTWVSELDVRVVPLNVDLATWARALDLDVQVQGLMAGGLRLTGQADRPELALGLQVTDMVLGEVPVSPAVVAMAADTGGYRSTVVLGAGDGSLSLGGLVPYDFESTAPLDLDVELARPGLDLAVSGSDIPVALLQIFDPGITEPSGVLEIMGVVEGSVAAPDPVVSFSVADGGFNYEPLLVKYTDLDLLVVLDHEQLTVEQGTVLTEPMYTDTRSAIRDLTQSALERTGVDDTRFAQGIATGVSGGQRADRPEPEGGLAIGGSAHLGLDGLRDVQLDVGSNFAWIMDTQTLVLAYTGDVSVSGDWPDLVVGGDLGFDKFRYVLDARAYLGQEGLRLDPTLTISRPDHVSVALAPPEPEFWESWDIQAAVDLGFNTKLKVEVPLDTSYGTLTASASSVQFDSFVRGEVDVSVRGYDVYAEGAIETYEGTTRILGKSFGMERGVVTFAGSDIANPALDIEATHETTQYGDISVKISNNVEQLAMAFDSSEGWSETDIVAILLLGRPTSQLSQSEGGSSVEALDIALGMVAGQVEKLAGDNLVDTIEIETSSEAALEGVKVGWALGRNLFFTLNYTATTDDDENQIEGTLEWIPVSSVHFTATTGDQGQSALEVFKVWKF